MSRPRKNNADWFSHDTNMRDSLKLKAVRAKYGLQGYAIFAMLLEVLADAENFTIYEDDFQIEMLAGDFRIDSELLSEMIVYFSKIGLLQYEGGKWFNKHLIERMESLLKKRNNMRNQYSHKSEAETVVSVAENPVTEAEKKKKKTVPEIPLMTESDFEAFWTAYPIKEEKKRSREKFLRLERSLLPVILESIEKNKTHNEKWLKGFIKQPTTWINGECWNDEIKPVIHNPSKHGQAAVSTEGHFDLEV